MSLETLKAKLEKGEMLTTDEQKELFSLVNADFEKIKQENPKKYLELVTSLTQIVSDLNKDIIEAKKDI
ncbi:MAG: hypothetical protein Q7R71_00910 [bacterium]|nr:hypothetical protein [bacterium]